MAGGVFLQAGRIANVARTPEKRSVERIDMDLVIVLKRDSAG
jgi:hypothetical protein